MKVEEIAEAVANLPPDQLARFRRWFTGLEAGRTNHVEELDSAATKLGRLAGRAFAELKTRAKEPLVILFNCLVGARKQRDGRIEAERLVGLDLITSSNFVDCITGRSPRFRFLEAADVVSSAMRLASPMPDVVACDHRCIPIDRPGLRGFGDDWPPGLCRPGLHPTMPWSDRGHCAQAHQGDAGKSRWQWNSP